MDPHRDQDHTAHDAEWPVDADEQRRDGRETKRGDRRIRGIGRGNTSPREEAMGPAPINRPPDDQQADGAEGEGDREPDRQAAAEEVRAQGVEEDAGVGVGAGVDEGFGVADGLGVAPPVPICMIPVTVP